jgi:hypothetical protein
MDELDARVARVECECIALRDALSAAMLAIEANAQAAARNTETLDAARGALAVNAELVARNVALTAATAPAASYARAAPSAAAPANTVVVRHDASGVALLGNSATFAMRNELKRFGSWVTDAPARWVIAPDAWEQNKTDWSTRFGVTFAHE